MPLAVVGVSHRTAPLELRERFALGRGELPAALLSLARGGGECVILSTCNRTEVYLAAPDGDRAAAAVEEARALLAARAGEDAHGAARYLYLHRDRDAARHLFRVAAGLDSMIVGEPQIQGQVKDAYAAAREAAGEGGPVVGASLNRLFQQAFSIGGRVRAETALGRGAASVSSAAVDLAKKIFGSLRGRRALVLGAGEMSEVTLECLRAEGVQSVIVANRTWERARELAERLECVAVQWDQLGPALARADIAICSTAAPHPVLTVERVRKALPHGPSGPLCVIDIAVPRDVEPAVGDVPNVFLYNLDDLQQVVEASLGRRHAELPAAEAIVARGVDDFWGWYAGLAVVPTIRDLRERSEAVRRAEVERALRQLSHLSAEDQVAIDALTRSLLNKILHAPTARLREAAGNGRGTGVLDTVRYLFELDAHAAASAETADDDADAAPIHANRSPDPDRA